MPGYRPLDIWDYKINDAAPNGPRNNLLDDDGRAAFRGSGADAGLAAIAEAINAHADEMLPAHLERAIWWLKDWKCYRSGWYGTNNSGSEYYQTRERLRNADGNHRSSQSLSSRRDSRPRSAISRVTSGSSKIASTSWDR